MKETTPKRSAVWALAFHCLVYFDLAPLWAAECMSQGSEPPTRLAAGCTRAARDWFVYGNLQAAEDWCKAAICEQEDQKHDNEWLIYPLIKLGSVYALSSEPEKAVGLFSRVLAIRRRLYATDHPCISEIEEQIALIRELQKEGGRSMK